jgi:hypothetical protein
MDSIPEYLTPERCCPKITEWPFKTSAYLGDLLDVFVYMFMITENIVLCQHE